MVFVPWVIFAVTFWLRSFDLRYQAERDSGGRGINIDDILSYCCLIPSAAFAYMTLTLAWRGEPKGNMAILTKTSIIAWIVAYFAGNWNYHHNMRAYYQVQDLNVYPSVDPSKYRGNQLMDAGMLQFTGHSSLWLEKSIGFKNGDVHCVAPIKSGNHTHKTYDFWAVGLNCCSAHVPSFRCGEYANPTTSRRHTQSSSTGCLIHRQRWMRTRKMAHETS
jgi:hypothetical protein